MSLRKQQPPRLRGIARRPHGIGSGGHRSGGRHRLLAFGLAVLAVGVLIVLPGYLAAQPGFFKRFPTLSRQYEPWSASTHVEAGCEGCHVPPKPLDRGVYRVRMIGEFYASLASKSRVPGVFAEPTNDACLACHSDLRSVSPKGDLQIPHRAHVTILKMRCVECHSYLVHELSPEGKHTPPMVECLRCHDGDTAKDACSACHTQKAAPTSHAAPDWLVLHAKDTTDPACVTCHKWKDDWCADCHRDRPQSHAADWRATHGTQVHTHRSCEACHENVFCVRCHGELPQLNYDPTLELVK